MSEGWIGITDVWNEGTWQTSTEKNLPYTSWAEGEPNNADNAEDCAVQRSDKTWNDISCRTQKSFICQLIAGIYLRIPVETGPILQVMSDNFQLIK